MSLHRNGLRISTPLRMMWRVLLFMLLLCAAAVLFAWAAQAHEWYDFQCCNERDCRQTVLGEVERRDDGWFVVQTSELIPFADPRIRRSMDPLIHICVVKANGLTRCLYVPEVAG